MSGSSCADVRYQTRPVVTVGVVLLQRKRPWLSCKNPATGNEWKDDMLAKIFEILTQQLGFEKGKGNGEGKALQVVWLAGEGAADDAGVRRLVDKCVEERVDVVVVLQPTIADCRLAPVIAQAWGHSLVLCATPEEQTSKYVSGNSLVGTHAFGASLRQLGFLCHVVFADLAWEVAAQQLQQSISVSFATRSMKRAKMCLLGYQAPGFVDMHPNPFLLCKTFGTIFHHASLEEYFDLLPTISDEAIAQDAQFVKNSLQLTTNEEVGAEDVAHASRAFLAMKSLIDDVGADAIAIRCWPEMARPDRLTQWPYVSISRLASLGFPTSCEGDVDGAVGNMISKFLGCGVSYLSDWLEHDAKTITLWHGGMAPFQLSEVIGSPLGPCLGRHFNTKHAGVVNATVKIGMKVTVFRFWVFQERYHMLALEGITGQPRRHLLGNNGLVEVTTKEVVERGITDKFRDWVSVGFPHHVSVVEGHHADTLTMFAKAHGVVIVI